MMGAIFSRFIRKPILAITFALLITILLASIVIVNNYLPDPYPNSNRIHSETFTFGGFDPLSGDPRWDLMYYTEDTTIDSSRKVYDWYKQNASYDFANTSRNYIGWSSTHRIPMIGSIRTGNIIMISECGARKPTCIHTKRMFGIVFTGFLGELLAGN